MSGVKRVQQRVARLLSNFAHDEGLTLGELRSEISTLINDHGKEAEVRQQTCCRDCDACINDLALNVYIERAQTPVEAAAEERLAKEAEDRARLQYEKLKARFEPTGGVK